MVNVSDLKTWPKVRLPVVIGATLAWVALFKLNALAFSSLEHSLRAHWIFLPAALRVISVVLYEQAGAIGLAVGAYLTLPRGESTDLPWELMLAMSSGLAPLVGVQLCRRVIALDQNLVGLTGKHIALLSVVTALVNSALVNGCMVIAHRWHGDFEQIATIVVGDVAGAAVVLAIISIFLQGLVRFAR